MKQLILLLFSAAIIFGCNPHQSTTEGTKSSNEILFQVKDDIGFNTIPWISIKEPEKYLQNLIGKDDVVLAKKEAILLIDYPLNKPVEIEIRASNPNGFKRGELIQIISREYKRIYKEEEESARNKTVPVTEREGIVNRNQTDGKYRIWGHNLDDLDLSAIIVNKSDEEKPKLELFIQS